MAMQKCFHSHHPFSSREKVNFQSCKALISSTISFSSSSSSFAHSLNLRYRSSRIVCKSYVDEVDVVTACSWNNLVVASDSPVLVEFWAPWCGPCRMIAPVINELAKEYAGKILCFKLNTDDCPTIASQYGIKSIPTVLFFKDGEKRESVIGAVPKSTLTATIEKYLDI